MIAYCSNSLILKTLGKITENYENNGNLDVFNEFYNI